VAVRRERLDLSGYVDPALPDFPVAMVPFWNAPAFAGVAPAERLRLLGAAWVVYNEKTISVENDVITPLCNCLLRDELPGISRPRVKEVIAQMQVDEQFHVLMCLEVCNSARRRHRLDRLVVPKSLVVRRQEALLAELAPGRAQALARLAYATVAEMTLNAFLRALSVDETIQPLNRLNTDLHRRDEGAHALIFRELAAGVFRALPSDEQATFNHHLGRALRDFTEPDPSGWEACLRYLELSAADDLLAGLRTPGRKTARDYGRLVALLDDLGNRGAVGFDFE
jgi:hypothetical protein